MLMITRARRREFWESIATHCEKNLISMGLATEKYELCTAEYLGINADNLSLDID